MTEIKGRFNTAVCYTEEIEEGFAIMIDESKNVYIFTKEFIGGIYNEYILYLDKIINQHNNELTFVRDSTTKKITNIKEIEVWIKYVQNDIDPLNILKQVWCVDFKKDKRKIELDYYNIYEGQYVPYTFKYKLIDYSSSLEEILKEFEITFSKGPEFLWTIESCTDLITKEHYEFLKEKAHIGEFDHHEIVYFGYIKEKMNEFKAVAEELCDGRSSRVSRAQ
mgnify:CR=1 FL=1